MTVNCSKISNVCDMTRVSIPMTKSLSFKRINTFMEVVHEKSVSSKTKYGEMVECSHSALIHNY